MRVTVLKGTRDFLQASACAPYSGLQSERQLNRRTTEQDLHTVWTTISSIRQCRMCGQKARLWPRVHKGRSRCRSTYQRPIASCSLLSVLILLTSSPIALLNLHLTTMPDPPKTWTHAESASAGRPLTEEIARDHETLKQCYENYKKATTHDEKQEWVNQYVWTNARHAIAEGVFSYSLSRVVHHDYLVAILKNM